MESGSVVVIGEGNAGGEQQPLMMAVDADIDCVQSIFLNPSGIEEGVDQDIFASADEKGLLNCGIECHFVIILVTYFVCVCVLQLCEAKNLHAMCTRCLYFVSDICTQFARIFVKTCKNREKIITTQVFEK